MKVKMLVQTTHQGRPVLPGEWCEVDDAVGKRWVARHIAEAEKPAPKPTKAQKEA